MSGKININKLKPHPKNSYYFTDLTGEKYEEVKRSIEVNGIRDPIKCTTSYTVISGHQRLRIAKELEHEEVPVTIVDVDEWKAEYLLIAENVERRGQAETDAIKKARIANFLKEYWGVNRGRFHGNQVLDKMSDTKTNLDIANTIGESEKTTQRILKLNDLIPEIQELVSSKKLGTTAAEQLAYLPQEDQKTLIQSKLVDMSKITVDESKKLRKTIESLNKELESERNKKQQVEVKTIEKEVDKTDYQIVDRLKEENERSKKKLERLERDKALLEKRLLQEEADANEHRKLKEELRTMSNERESIHRQVMAATSLSKAYVEIENLLKEELAPIRYSRAITEAQDSEVAMNNLSNVIGLVEEWARDMRSFLPDNKNNTNIVEVIDYE